MSHDELKNKRWALTFRAWAQALRPVEDGGSGKMTICLEAYPTSGTGFAFKAVHMNAGVVSTLLCQPRGEWATVGEQLTMAPKSGMDRRVS